MAMVKIPEKVLRVELRFRLEVDGGRRSAVNLSDGRYRPLVIAGRRDTVSEDEAMGRQEHKLFGVCVVRGPEEVHPGTTANAIIFALVHPEGVDELITARVFSVCEGSRVVADGRVVMDSGEAV